MKHIYTHEELAKKLESAQFRIRELESLPDQSKIIKQLREDLAKECLLSKDLADQRNQYHEALLRNAAHCRP